MPEYDNTNSGALFKNMVKVEEPREDDRRPDYRGSLDCEGTDYWISAWLKTSKAGKKYMSLAITPKEEQRVPGEDDAAYEADDSDLPF